MKNNKKNNKITKCIESFIVLLFFTLIMIGEIYLFVACMKIFIEYFKSIFAFTIFIAFMGGIFYILSGDWLDLIPDI